MVYRWGMSGHDIHEFQRNVISVMCHTFFSLCCMEHKTKTTKKSIEWTLKLCFRLPNIIFVGVCKLLLLLLSLQEKTQKIHQDNAQVKGLIWLTITIQWTVTILHTQFAFIPHFYPHSSLVSIINRYIHKKMLYTINTSLKEIVSESWPKQRKCNQCWSEKKHSMF